MTDREETARDPASAGGAGEESGRERTPRLAEMMQPEAHPGAAWWRASVIGAIALLLAAAALIALWFLARPLLLLFLAIVIAETLRPIVSLLGRWMHRGLAVGLVYLAGVGLVGVAGWLVLPALVRQARQLVDRAPELIEETRSLVEQWDPTGSDRALQAAEVALGRFGNSLISLPFTVLSSLADLLIVLFLSIYWLLASDQAGRFARSLLPETRHAGFDRLMHDLGWAIGGYLRSEMIGGVIVGAIVYTGLTIIGLDFAILLAVISAVAELIPIAGPVLAAIPAVTVGFLDSTTTGLMVLGFYVVVQQVESNILVPNLMQHQAGLPPMIALFAVFAGGAAFGVLGAIAALPLAAALRVVILAVVAPAIRRWTGAAAGAG